MLLVDLRAIDSDRLFARPPLVFLMSGRCGRVAYVFARLQLRRATKAHDVAEAGGSATLDAIRRDDTLLIDHHRIVNILP